MAPAPQSTVVHAPETGGQLEIPTATTRLSGFSRQPQAIAPADEPRGGAREAPLARVESSREILARWHRIPAETNVSGA
jgi:hypothetical protein